MYGYVCGEFRQKTIKSFKRSIVPRLNTTQSVQITRGYLHYTMQIPNTNILQNEMVGTGSSWFSSVPTGKYGDSIRPLSLPSKSFPIHHLSVTLSFNAISVVDTDTIAKWITKNTPHVISDTWPRILVCIPLLPERLPLAKLSKDPQSAGALTLAWPLVNRSEAALILNRLHA
jgi:hypothetical protein